MNMARLVLSGKRVPLISPSEVIVVSTQKHHALGRATGVGRWEKAGDVVSGTCLPFEGNAQGQLDVLDIEAGHVRIRAVQLFLHLGKRFACHVLENPIGDLPSDTRGHNPRASDGAIER